MYGLMMFAVVGAVAYCGTWAVRAMMLRAGIMDYPGEGRKLHQRPVAYEGGLAIWLGVVAGLVVAAITRDSLFFVTDEILAIITGATAITAVGVADDLLDLRPWLKLLAQLGIGAMMYYLGFRVDLITNPFGDSLAVPPVVSLIGTCLWYAILINGINMIDGMDGLAAGIVMISSCTLLAVNVSLDLPFAALLCLILGAAVAGFLPFNLAPATIFMGDAGSMLLGFLLATITLLSSTKTPALLALIIPVVAVGLPLFETVFAFIRRALSGQHPFRADRRHLHHRFLALGFSPRRTVLSFYYITAFFGVVAFVLQGLEAAATLALAVIVLVGMLLLIENLRFLENLHVSCREDSDPMHGDAGLPADESSH